MNGVVGDESKERLGFVFSYKAAGGICDGTDFLGVVREGLPVALVAFSVGSRLIRGVCFAGGDQIRGTDIEALLTGSGALAGTAEMPLAEVPGDVAQGFQGFRHGDEIRVQLRGVGHGIEAEFLFGSPVRGTDGIDPVARTVFSGEQAGAAGRAIPGGGIGLGERHALLFHPVEVGRFDETSIIVIRDILPAEIVGENEDDIGRSRGSRRSGAGHQGKAGEEEQGGFHAMAVLSWPDGGGGRSVWLWMAGRRGLVPWR